MRLVTTTVRGTELERRKIALRPALACHLKSLSWLASVLVLLALNSVHVHAAKQKIVRKEAPKAKPSPAPVRKTASVQRGLLATLPQPIDPFEKRVHMTHEVRSGETVLDMLGRYGLPDTERRLWARSLARDLGRPALPAGREVHLYFASPTFTRAKKMVPGQLKAVEVDRDDASTLTWEKGIKGILFQKREKPYDVEVKTVSGAVETSLFEDGRKAGIQSALLSQLADIFTWDIDLEK
jgi:hypothetical protein